MAFDTQCQNCQQQQIFTHLSSKYHPINYFDPLELVHKTVNLKYVTTYNPKLIITTVALKM